MRNSSIFLFTTILRTKELNVIVGSSCLKIRPFVRLYSTKQGMAELGICMTQSAHGGDHSVSLHFLQAPSCIAGCRRIRRDTSGCIRSTGTPSTRSRSNTTYPAVWYPAVWYDGWVWHMATVADLQNVAGALQRRASNMYKGEAERLPQQTVSPLRAGHKCETP
jgi:hypothetical protein